MFSQTLADDSSDEHSFSNSLDTIAAPTTKDPSLILPHSNTSTSKDKNTKKSTKSSSQRTSNAVRRKSSTKKQKDRLFTDTDSDSDTSLPFPTDSAPQVVTSDPLLHVLDNQRENSASILRLSDSSDDDVMVTHVQGSSLQSVESSKQADRLTSQCSQVIYYLL